MNILSFFVQYDATIAGGTGGGGEYEVQLGFGWSNGVIMDLLDMYGSEITAFDDFDVESNENTNASTVTISGVSSVVTGVLVLVASIAAGMLG